MLMMSVRNWLGTMAIVAALGACATPTLCQPRSEEAASGYSERRLDETHWRVEFAGDETASQETVESYLLFRAAELTSASGYDWFLPSQHELDVESELVIEAVPTRQSAVWRPLWRQRRTYGWTDWMPRGPQSSQPSSARQFQSRFVERFAAREEIAMGRGAAPAVAFEARAVLELLGPTIARPAQGVEK